MKKQTKSPESKQVVVVHNRRQRILGIFALVGVFVCGMFVGMSMRVNNVQENKQESSFDYFSEQENKQKSFESKTTCEQIEILLGEQLHPTNSSFSDDHISNAKIYANLSERGCPENSQKYVELAKQELQIARALQDDRFHEEETIEVVETYKRLNMQAAAEEIFEKAKKLTNPAIDFIIEVEKIINEK